jgi:CBS domain containing-hemolysin-like protein
MQVLTPIILAMLTLFVISLQRTYSRIPAKELKYRARQGDALAAAFHKASVYGPSLRVLLWILIGLSAGAFFVYVGRFLPLWAALPASALLIWLGFIWIPSGEATSISQAVASHVAPLLAKILYYLHPIIERIRQIALRLKRVRVHTGLYEKADLLDLIDEQFEQTDNRIAAAELEIAHGALTFGDKLVGDVMTPRRAVKMVAAEDDLGPVIMTELHESGHSRFPVFEGKEDTIIGTLFLRDLVKRRSGGKVRNVMKKTALYLHEEQTLYDALQAILKTHHHLFIVVNSFEEYVGIITIEDVLEQIVGQAIVDEFDEYDNLRAVAARAAKEEHKAHSDPEKTDSAKSDIEVDDTVEID